MYLMDTHKIYLMYLMFPQEYVHYLPDVIQIHYVHYVPDVPPDKYVIYPMYSQDMYII